MSIFPAIQYFEIFERFLLFADQHACDEFLVLDSFCFQPVWNHIVDVLDEDDVGIKVIQIFYQSAMTTRTEKNFSILSTEWGVIWICGNGVCAGFLLGEIDAVLHAKLVFILRSHFCHQCFKQRTVLWAYCEMNVHLTILSTCVECAFYQMFFHRCACAIFIFVEL